MPQDGVVSWFNSKKGWGFIESLSAQYFLHYSEIKMAGFKKIEKGSWVSFESFEDEKGLKARSVSLHPEPPQ